MKLLGQLRVVFGELHGDVAEVAVGQAARGHPGQAARIHRLLDGLAVDGVHERLAHADVVEGLVGHVDVEALLAAGPAPVDDVPHLLDLVREVGGDHFRIQHVEGALLEADQLGGVLGHVEPVHLVDLRLAARELVEGLEHDLLAGRVPLEVEGPGAHGVPLEPVAELVHGLLGENVALLVADHAQEEDRVKRLQDDLDGVGVDDLDGLDHVQVHAVARARRLLDLPLEAELHVLGGQLTEPLVELHAFLELERPDRALGRERPALGEVGLHLGRGDLAVLDGKARQPPEHEPRDGLRLPERARVRIERVRLLGRDVEDLPALRLGRDGHHRRQQHKNHDTSDEPSRHGVPFLPKE